MLCYHDKGATHMLFPLKWNQMHLVLNKGVHSLPDRYETASNISIYLRIEGNSIFKGWDSIRKMYFVSALSRKQNILNWTSCLHDTKCSESSAESRWTGHVIGSIAQITRWPLTNIPQSAWSHPSKLNTGYWSKMLSFVHTLIFVFPNDRISSQGVQELSLAKPNLFQSIIYYFLYLVWLFWDSLDNEIWDATTLVGFNVLFCSVFSHLRARVSKANNTQDDGSCPLHCQLFQEEN